MSHDEVAGMALSGEFTAEGTAVEWGGDGATYIYSDAPLPLNVPKLNRR